MVLPANSREHAMAGQQVPLLGQTINNSVISGSTTCTDTGATSLASMMMMRASATISFLCWFFFGNKYKSPPAAPRGTSIRLPSYPLAVKHPYLSTWVPGDQLDDIATARPEFWSGQDLSWPILARVDSCTYALFGVPDSDPGIDGIVSARTESVSYTSTHTLFQLSAGRAKVVLDFFSPVSPAPEDYARQSLPYSYLTVSVSNPTHHALDVQVGAGIDHTWTNQNGVAQLNFAVSDSAQFFEFHNPDEILFTETNEAMATYGTVVWATTNDNTTSYATGSISDVFDNFAKTGFVSARQEKRDHHDVAALSKDLGCIHTKQTKNATFVVGFDRTDAIDYLNNTQTGYYRTRWPNIPEAVDFVLQDYDIANLASQKFDRDVRTRSESVSKVFGRKYADIIEASVRQTFGALELTVPKDDLAASPSVFLKEISSNGNLNTVDVMFQTWPVFVSLNPEYIRMFLQPMMSYLELPRSEGWPKPWVIHDMGASYPNATGHSNGEAEQMPLFETSSLFILLLAYQKYSGNTAYAQAYRPLLESYADYLIHNSLYPSSQLISVDAIPATANQTGLTIQSAIGLKAASVLLHNDTLAEIATSFARTIYDQGLGLDGSDPEHSSHFTYNYDKDETWNVLFPAYSDVLLDLQTFPPEAWEMQSKWYESQLCELGLPFAGPASNLDYIGKPLLWGLVDWNIVAAGASSPAVQEAIIKTTHAYLTNGKHNVPFGTKYNVEGPEIGRWIGNRARSTVGSNFALLALKYGYWGKSR